MTSTYQLAEQVRAHYAQVCHCEWTDDEFTRSTTSAACSIHGRVPDPLTALLAALEAAEQRVKEFEDGGGTAAVASTAQLEDEPMKAGDERDGIPEQKDAPCNICGRGWPYHYERCSYLMTANALADALARAERAEQERDQEADWRAHYQIGEAVQRERVEAAEARAVSFEKALRELATNVLNFCENEVPPEWDGGSVGYEVGGLAAIATDALSLLAASVPGGEQA